MAQKRQTDLPAYATDLIQELDALYPERSPALHETIDEIRYRSGQRSVVNALLARLPGANKTPPPNPELEEGVDIDTAFGDPL